MIIGSKRKRRCVSRCLEIPTSEKKSGGQFQLYEFHTNELILFEGFWEQWDTIVYREESATENSVIDENGAKIDGYYFTTNK